MGVGGVGVDDLQQPPTEPFDVVGVMMLRLRRSDAPRPGRPGRGRGRRGARRWRGGSPRPARPAAPRPRAPGGSARGPRGPRRAGPCGGRRGGWCGCGGPASSPSRSRQLWPATSTVSAWVSSRVLSSASWASARSTSSITAVVSAASIDHSGTSATSDSWSRTAATAPVTRWAWWAVAVMEPIQAPTTDSPPARKPVLHKGNRRSCRGFETVAARPPQPPTAKRTRPHR